MPMKVTPYVLAALATFLPAATPTTPAAPSAATAREGGGPQVGQIAPELKFSAWIQRGKEKEAPRLANLRGRVVIVHTFAWNCSSCLKVGIPLAVDLQEANADRGLNVISVTTPAFLEKTRKVMAEFGMVNSVAAESPFQSQSPYVDMSANPITYMFVIGRNGELAWRGNPSSELDEFLDAVQRSLNQRPGRDLERPLRPELEESIREYFAQDYRRARKLAAKVQAKYSKRKGDEAETAAADAGWLIEKIDALGRSLLEELETSLEKDDAASFLAAQDELENGFAKTEVWKQATEVIQRAKEKPGFDLGLESAALWSEILLERPPLFPQREDKASKRYSRKLKSFVDKHGDSPHRREAEELLAAYLEKRER